LGARHGDCEVKRDYFDVAKANKKRTIFHMLDKGCVGAAEMNATATRLPEYTFLMR
jgi:hypothetical protein